MHNGKPWNTEADESLRTEVGSGASLFAISRKLDRSESAIKSRAYILRLSLRNNRDETLPNVGDRATD